MAMPIVPRRSAGSSLSAELDEFAGLSRRLLVSINHVVLVSQHFGDLADLPPEHAPAGMTLHMAAQDLDRLYNEIDSWHVRHEHVPKSADVSGGGVFTDDDSARTPLTGLPPALSCPFCGRHDDIMVSQIQDAGDTRGPWFRVNCGTCGVDAPGGDTPLVAAQEWNKRGTP
jgi:hypothetical protein